DQVRFRVSIPYGVIVFSLDFAGLFSDTVPSDFDLVSDHVRHRLEIFFSKHVDDFHNEGIYNSINVYQEQNCVARFDPNFSIPD
ncbi:hypothetical protein OE165_27890, partial [Escherichia coli]|uniref:hypothetical protein n=1 Tax=Escherichia coli TaxID=562 RepID=UPI0021F36059